MVDGFVTQDRPTPRRIISSRTWDGYGYTSVADCLRFWNPRQVTTSYRTGRASGVSEPSTSEEIVDQSGSYRDMFHALKADQQNSPPLGTDTGHDFDTLRQDVSVGTTSANLKGFDGGRVWRYDGPVMPDLGLTVPGTYYHGSLFGGAPDVAKDRYGPAAINALAPTNPYEALAVGLAELKSEGFPPSTNLDHWKEMTARARTAGEAHLEVQFGWLPLISDVQKTFYAIKHASQLLAQFQRDSGQTIRRSMTFPTEVTEEAYDDMYTTAFAENVSPSAFASMWQGRSTGGVLTEHLRSQTTVRFSGAFTYFLQRDNSTLNKLRRYEQEINHLLGTRVTPETLWNLAPWSWLSDWKMNIGANISNAVRLSEDGLVLRYGYLMAETISDHTLQLHGPVPSDGSCGPISLNFTTVRKQRVRANPYGFSIDPSGFSLRQWSILGALGITKAPEKLW